MLTLSLPLALTGCGSSSAATGSGSTASADRSTAGTSAADGSQAPVPVESNPPGDIPDDVAFVRYSNPVAGYSFTHPEGWAQLENGSAVTFTDKLNGIQADTAGLPSALDEATVRSQELPALQAAQPAFQLVSVSPVALPAGSGFQVVYQRNSDPDPVTGRRVRDEVQEFLISDGASALRLSLVGPVGADNVDAYRTISQSLTLR